MLRTIEKFKSARKNFSSSPMFFTSEKSNQFRNSKIPNNVKQSYQITILLPSNCHQIAIKLRAAPIPLPFSSHSAPITNAKYCNEIVSIYYLIGT